MGVDSRSKGRGFESQRRILDGHFFTLICCKNCIVCLKRPKINKKEAGVGPIFFRNLACFYTVWLRGVSMRKLYQFDLIYRVDSCVWVQNMYNKLHRRSLFSVQTQKKFHIKHFVVNFSCAGGLGPVLSRNFSFDFTLCKNLIRWNIWVARWSA